MSSRPALIAMVSLCLALASGGAGVGQASAQAMSPAASPAASAPPAQSAVDPVAPAPASSPVVTNAASPTGASPAAAPASARRSVLDPKADRGRNDVLGRLLPKKAQFAGTDKVFPKADLAAPLTDCPATRPASCSLDYAPVCAEVDTGVRCVAAPCPSSTRKTFGSACKACRAPNVTGYATGECPAP
jgi:hypothetical protein